MSKLEKIAKKVGEWILTILMLIIVYGGAFGAAVWVIKWIIRLFGGM